MKVLVVDVGGTNVPMELAHLWCLGAATSSS
jgi:hypothetical protein